MEIGRKGAKTNFIAGENCNYLDAKVVVVPVPFEGTVTYKTGTSKGPEAIIDASQNIEWFDEELLYEPAQLGFFTMAALDVRSKKPEEVAAMVEESVSQLLEDGKFPMLLGGEHSVSAGAFSAFRKKFGDFTILQFDAHPDLREDYEGSKYSHACIMRRAFDLGIGIVQVGIRGVCREDYEFMETHKGKVRTFYAKDMGEWDLNKIVDSCSEKVYISFDIDAFDSSVMPATGTPEPGGVYWRQVVGILQAISNRKKIIGADVVELLPTPGLHACDFLAAKLAYKIIGCALKKNNSVKK
ncbi:MAG: agmatinase [Candidatus Micrarchaeota archaeon]